MYPFNQVLHRLDTAGQLRLAETVAGVYRITLMQMLSGSLASGHVGARQELWCWLVIDGWLVADVARLFGVDRSTVEHGVRVTRPVPHGDGPSVVERLEQWGLLGLAQDVAAEHSISIDAMFSASRWFKYAAARQMLWRRARQRGIRTTRLARIFGVTRTEPLRLAGGAR
jgi:hypothetical protein